MKITLIKTSNWDNAFYGLRNPMDSWAKSDSIFGLGFEDDMLNDVEEVSYNYLCEAGIDPNQETKEKEKVGVFLLQNGVVQNSTAGIDTDALEYALIGYNDMNLAQRMIAAGNPNDKFLRQIFVSMQITAPILWWKEMDTYKVGTVANSTSTMHTIQKKPITLKSFDTTCFDPEGPEADWVYDMIETLESWRKKFVETKDRHYWDMLISWLPESWLQTRMWTANYGALRNIIHWRYNHKLPQWHFFVDTCKQLPYAEQLLFYENIPGYEKSVLQSLGI